MEPVVRRLSVGTIYHSVSVGCQMFVRVKLFATLSRYALNRASGVSFDIELSEGATLDDVVNQLKLPREEVKVYFVNGRARPKDWILEPGDEVGIFPLVAGG